MYLLRTTSQRIFLQSTSATNRDKLSELTDPRALRGNVSEIIELLTILRHCCVQTK